MTSRDFCYWLQGYIEITLSGPQSFEPLNQKQMQLIQKHLSLVFIHEIDPSFPNGQQEALNKAHGSGVHEGRLLQDKTTPRC